MKRHVVLILLLLMTSCSSYEKDGEPEGLEYDSFIGDWHGIYEPSSGESEVFGGYLAGCLNGAEFLPKEGDGYYSVRTLRNREYGHPDTINFIKDFSGKVNNKYGVSLLISDIAHPRGGPTELSSAHRSHQTGLDVDIWYRYINKSEEFAEDLYPSLVVDAKNEKMQENWGDKNRNILKMAASFDKVERILVNPYIKKDLCEAFPKEAWLAKIRPWWGHNQHFHVRLACPLGSKYCKKQSPVPDDIGCDDSLDWWFSKEAAKRGEEPVERKYPKLPKQCRKIFNYENNF